MTTMNVMMELLLMMMMMMMEKKYDVDDEYDDNDDVLNRETWSALTRPLSSICTDVQHLALRILVFLNLRPVWTQLDAVTTVDEKVRLLASALSPAHGLWLSGAADAEPSVESVRQPVDLRPREARG
eukprot:762538-Hanusia_phi.AAC.3